MCNATNIFGHESSNGSLVVKERTRIIAGPTNYEAEAGSTATFRCHAEHDPSLPLRIRWFKDGEYINVNMMNRYGVDYIILTKKIHFWLKIYLSDPQNSGCLV